MKKMYSIIVKYYNNLNFIQKVSYLSNSKTVLSSAIILVFSVTRYFRN